ncbi:MAG: AAA family ATPase [Bacteroidales bacterium]|nr:AAA family ATPase [Bacteroidales bacterium]
MRKLKFDYADLDARSKKVDEVSERLKKEFFGIDKQIDQLVNAFKTWYLFPQFQDRPVVVNLYGMTGVGKTDLVNKLMQHMDMEKDKIYYNFAAIEELRAFDVEDDIEDDIYDKQHNKVFIFDEFQYAATLDEDGNEKKDRSGLKPFWELIDTGILNKRITHSNLITMGTTISNLIYINERMHIKLEKGRWMNEEECLTALDPWTISSMANTLNIDRDKYCNFKKKRKETDEDGIDEEVGPRLYRRSGGNDVENWADTAIVQKQALDTFYRSLRRVIDREIEEVEFFKELYTMEIDELILRLTEIQTAAMKGYKLDFKESLIFVIANLDEAYKLSFDVDPDMSPDQFRKISERITIVDIKKALQKRFRNEQIARLGNIHIIYPSFDGETFRKIISTGLTAYANDIKDKLDVTLEFDQSINDIIFKEGVFPTHGTRPIFSSIYEIVKSKLPAVLRQSYLQGIAEDYCAIRMSYATNNIAVQYLNCDGEEIGRLDIPQRFRVEDLRKNTKDNNQAISALHESGHFVACMAYTGQFPEKVVSRTANSGTGGFVLHGIDDDEFSTKCDLLNHIKVCVGGFVAEKLVFGDNDRTMGASSDLSVATQTAVKMIRRLGMDYDNFPFVSTRNPDSADLYVWDEDQQRIADAATQMIKDCIEEVETLFDDSDWRLLLQKSAQFLACHNIMKPSTMKRLYKIIPENKRTTVRDKKYYRRLIDSLSQSVE